MFETDKFSESDGSRQSPVWERRMSETLEELSAEDSQIPDHKSRASNKPILIRAYQAVQALERYVGGSVAAKKLLADKMRDQELRAKARRSWVSSNPNLKMAFKENPSDALRGIDIDYKKLVGARNLRSDIERWKWRSGSFFISRSNGVDKTIFTQVRFYKDDIDKILQYYRSDEILKDKYKGGRKSRIDARDDVWLAIVNIILRNAQDIFESEKNAPYEILREVIWSNENETLAATTVKPIVSKVRKALGMARGAANHPPSSEAIRDNI